MNIAFIAMSGIRAWDSELLELGLSMPGFLERSQVIASLPSLGLLTLAGCTPPGHNLSYHEIKDLDPDLSGIQADMVAISTFSAQIPEAYAVADQLREKGIRVVMGGLHITVLPDEALAHCDAVLIGEGEDVWPQMVEDAENGILKSTYRTDHEFDFADAPLPRFDLLDPAQYNRLTVQTSRGCPHRCSFCASSILLTEKYKQKPVAKVLKEIDAIRDIWPRPFIEFADDNSLLNKKWWRELLPELQSRNIRWFTETDISVGRDPVFLKELFEGGCHEVLIGLESPLLDGLPGTELNSDWKCQQLDIYRRNIHSIQSAGIRVNGCFIVGLDGQTTEIFDAVYDFAMELSLYDVQITYPTAFPGTPFFEKLSSENRLDLPHDWSKRTLFDIHFDPTPMTREELRAGFFDLTSRLYSDNCTKQRRKGYQAQRRRRNNPKRA